ncbi:hypothetical protein XSR1_390010 [Xenorhabdus szentirmaii DSM 16338]|uniref:Uncharacterized protein n=1 Tax=Xenorhabdus szentirmaii DSM 16338 TaxID=1427518 RepID=W1IZM4_9GAMM|nr:hypothetical protein XSR1_390010 [Xenorhabdus szentirmaii DSM 16338]
MDKFNFNNKPKNDNLFCLLAKEIQNTYQPDPGWLALFIHKRMKLHHNTSERLTIPLITKQQAIWSIFIDISHPTHYYLPVLFRQTF